ncbi:hypothetical protein LF1_50200 [Rubripirellula obstinata]|uniref:Uncharacterized protein n=1 Tax=Rubripirellula obstinata TaxID=406547 RepID=A0A5B1CPG9_9BACT|nr:hypothetical protein LF1_50200 [Rubripirellula obstinata]
MLLEGDGGYKQTFPLQSLLIPPSTRDLNSKDLNAKSPRREGAKKFHSPNLCDLAPLRPCVENLPINPFSDFFGHRSRTGRGPMLLEGDGGYK